MNGETLTEGQRFALLWIDRVPVKKSGWRQKGRPAYGPSEKWDAIKLEGPCGSIVITVADWKAILPYFEVAPLDEHVKSPWRLNAAGRRALTGERGEVDG